MSEDQFDEAILLCAGTYIHANLVYPYLCHSKIKERHFFRVCCTGATVIVEKAHASILLEEFKESHCHHCLHWMPGLVPCHQCSKVLLKCSTCLYFIST
jgi:hypothetical protein